VDERSDEPSADDGTELPVLDTAAGNELDTLSTDSDEIEP
jgi:hypothetical protein